MFFISFDTKYSLHHNLTFVFLFPFTRYDLNIRCGFNVVFVCLFAVTVLRTAGGRHEPQEVDAIQCIFSM